MGRICIPRHAVCFYLLFLYRRIFRDLIRFYLFYSFGSLFRVCSVYYVGILVSSVVSFVVSFFYLLVLV